MVVSEGSAWFVALANFHGVVSPTTVDFKWATWRHWTQVWEEMGAWASTSKSATASLGQTPSHDDNAVVPAVLSTRKTALLAGLCLTVVSWSTHPYSLGTTTILMYKKLTMFLCHPPETLCNNEFLSLGCMEFHLHFSLEIPSYQQEMLYFFL